MTSSVVVRTESIVATKRVAAELARALPRGTIVCLEGTLGVGKTTFAKGFVGALGVLERHVKSPTYALATTYPSTPHVHHLDLYRLTDDDTAFALGLEELLDDPDALILVEWPTTAPGLFHRRKTIRVSLEITSARRRRITISTSEESGDIRAAMEAMGETKPVVHTNDR